MDEYYSGNHGDAHMRPFDMRGYFFTMRLLDAWHTLLNLLSVFLVVTQRPQQGITSQKI